MDVIGYIAKLAHWADLGPPGRDWDTDGRDLVLLAFFTF